MRITLADDVIDALQAQLKPGTSLEQEIERRLTASAHVPARQPLIVLNTTEMDQLAERVGTGLPIRTAQDLFRAVDQLAEIRLGKSRLVFTPTQLRQVEERAQKAGVPLDQFIGMIAAKVVTDVFGIAPGDQGVFYTPGFDPDTELNADLCADQLEEQG